MNENQKLLEAIKEYQSCPYVHPLTCGTNSLHRLLKGVEINGQVVLECIDCSYHQDWIPEIVWHGKAMSDAMNKVSTE